MEEQSAFKHKPWIFQLYTAVAQKSQTAAFDADNNNCSTAKGCQTGCEPRGRVEDVDPRPRPPLRPTVAPVHNNRSRMTPEEKIYILHTFYFLHPFSPRNAYPQFKEEDPCIRYNSSVE